MAQSSQVRLPAFCAGQALASPGGCGSATIVRKHQGVRRSHTQNAQAKRARSIQLPCKCGQGLTFADSVYHFVMFEKDNKTGIFPA